VEVRQKTTSIIADTRFARGGIHAFGMRPLVGIDKAPTEMAQPTDSHNGERSANFLYSRT
jgi:hypothetical protein